MNRLFEDVRVRGVGILVTLCACGPSVGVPSAGGSESTTSGEATATVDSITATATSSPSTSESSTTGSADITSGETTIALDVGDASSSTTFDRPPWLVHCDRCGPDEVCLDTCSPTFACVPIPEECEEVTCDDPDCAQALCGDEECLGYGGLSCHDTFSDAFVCGHSGLTIECDLWSQDCPDGEKCIAWSDDNDVYDHTHCIPVARMPAAVGEPCTVEDYALSGIDDCDFGAQCLEVDPDTLVGMCRALCTGSEANPSCEDPEMTCVMNDELYGWCVP